MPDLNRLLALAGAAALGEPGAYAREEARSARSEIENPPINAMAQSSKVVDAARQILPHKFGDIGFVQQVTGMLPKGVGDAIGTFPLEVCLRRPSLIDSRPSRQPEVAETTTEIGRAPTDMQGKAKALEEGDIAGRAAQVAGMAAGDILTDGMRNIWWFLNAPQAVSQIAVLQAMNNAKNANIDTSVRLAEEPLLKSRALRMAATAPAVIAVSMGLGNAFRQPGYKAVVPDENDPTKTANLGQELVDRYFLGRSGALLPYDEFVKERPDVSREEYNQYKNYLFGDKSVVKATMDGVQGPEVTFMGESLP